MTLSSTPQGASSVGAVDIAAWNRALNRTHAMSRMRERGGAVVRAVEARRRALVARRVLGGRHACVIDVGCEDGWMSEAWAPLVRHLVLVDVDPVPLRAARRRIGAGVRTAVADACDVRALRAVPFAGRADVVVLSAVLEHLPEPGRALAACRGLLAPRGRLIVYVPADGPILAAKRVLSWTGLGRFVRGLSLDAAPGHLHRFDRDRLVGCLSRHGRIADVAFDPAVLGFVAVLRPFDGA